MTWPVVVVLLVVATGLSATGAVVAREQRRDAAVEVRARHATLGLVLMATALALAAVAGALLGAGRTGRAQVVVFLAVAAAPVLPLLVGWLAGGHRLRRARGDRPPQLRG